MKLFVRGLTAAIVLFIALTTSWAADEDFEIPFVDIPEFGEISTNAVVFDEDVAPSLPYTPAALIAPTPSVSFQGLGDTGTGFPADTQGAVGPEHIMTMLNTQVRVQDRVGNTNLTKSLFSWWTNAGTFSRVFDPRVTFDPYKGRWIATACADGGVNPTLVPSSALLFAVSQGSDPTGGWYYRKIDGDANDIKWVDFPSLGFNTNWIAVSVNMTTNKTNIVVVNGTNTTIVVSEFSNVKLHLFDKANAYTNGTNVVITNLPWSSLSTIVPAVTYDATNSTLYCLQNFGKRWDGAVQYKGYLTLYKITGAVATPTLTPFAAPSTFRLWRHRFSTDPNNPQINSAPQTNSIGKIYAGDARIQSAVFRNNRVFGVQTIFLPEASPNRSSIQWWRMNADGSSPVTGIIDDSTSSNHFAYPSLAVNHFNDILIGYSSFSLTQYVSAHYTFRTANDTATRPPQLLKAGVDVYQRGTVVRWGDYSATLVDPLNDIDFWTVQTYAAQQHTNGSGRFGAWWGKIVPTVPINDRFTNATVLSGTSGTTNATLFRSSRESGEPFHVGSTNNSIWFTWTAGSDGLVTFDTIKSPAETDTVIAAYTGSAVASLSLIASNDNTKITSGFTTVPVKTSLINFYASSGTTYRITVASKLENADQITLNWLQPQAPVFVEEPDNEYLLAGHSFTLSSTAIGTPGPSYQWRSNSVNLTGATSSSYTKTNAQSLITNGPTTFEYTVVASNSSGSRTSRVSYVTVYTDATSSHDDFELLSGGRFKFTVTGISNYLYTVQASSDFTNWTNLTNRPASFFFTNQIDTNVPYLFFRSAYSTN